MDYTLDRSTGVPKKQPRIVPPKGKGRLRKGGGRKDSPGWTEQKRKTNRERFDELRPHIKTGVTIIPPSHAKPRHLEALGKCCRNFCSKAGIPARGVWEGPGPHIHISLGISYDAELRKRWLVRLEKLWGRAFACKLDQQAFFWNREEDPQALASYLSKTRDHKTKTGEPRMVKAAFEWLTFTPYWETNFRNIAPCGPRKKRAESSASVPTEKEGSHDSPYYTGIPTEKEGGGNAPVVDIGLVDPVEILAAHSPTKVNGKTFSSTLLHHALPWRLLSLRVDMGGLETALALHQSGHLLFACCPPSRSIVHMLISPQAALPPNLKVQLRSGTAIPANFEGIYSNLLNMHH